MSAWPAVTFEEMTWKPTYASGFGPGIEAFTGGPRVYQASVPPSITDQTISLPAEVAIAADEAGRELSRFDAELGHRVAAFGPVLLRSEAAASSQIEHLSASARAIFTAEISDKGPRNAAEIAANTAALAAAIALADDITPDAIRHMHAVLMADRPQHTPGAYRTEPVWIGTSADSPVGAAFVPPRWERIADLVDDLVRFAHRLDIAALTVTALAHAQFETIHPFSDGNGRTGRALVQAMLRYRGVTRSIAVPVSAGLLTDVDGYHAALTAYRDGDCAPIVSRFTTASLRAIVNARQLVVEIDDIVDGWKDTLRVRADSGVWSILDLIARKPVVDAKAVAADLNVDAKNVYPLLARLEDQGILAAKTEHRRSTLWRSDPILHAIDRFAARAGRRE